MTTLPLSRVPLNYLVEHKFLPRIKYAQTHVNLTLILPYWHANNENTWRAGLSFLKARSGHTFLSKLLDFLLN